MAVHPQKAEQLSVSLDQFEGRGFVWEKFYWRVPLGDRHTADSVLSMRFHAVQR